MIRSPDYYILWLIVVALLAGNIWAGANLLETKKELAVFIENTSMAVTEAGSSELPYTINISQKIPFNAEVNLSDGLRVPVKTAVPINTVVDVPITLPVIGTTIIRVPINTTVPIDMTLDLTLEKNIPVQGVTNLSLAIPVEIKNTPLGTAINTLARELQKLRDQLGQ